MPHHTRRSFAASASVLAGMAVSGAVAQEATPRAGLSEPAALLTQYLGEVINQGNHAAIYDLFDPTVYDLDELYWAHVEEDARLRKAGVSPRSIVSEIADGLGYSIIHGYRTTDDGSSEPTFYLVKSRAGLIVELRRLSGETYTPLA